MFVKIQLPFLVIFYLFQCCPGAYAQIPADPSVFMEKGKKHYDLKEYTLSASFYKQAFEAITDRSVFSRRYQAAYNGACSWALAGQTDSALVFLEKAAQEPAFGTYYKQMLKDEDFVSLYTDKRWAVVCSLTKINGQTIEENRNKITADLYDTTKRINSSLVADSLYWKKQSLSVNFNQLKRKIQSLSSFRDAPVRDWWTVYKIRVNDTLEVPYLVHIPAGYDPGKKTPLCVFLHGGVGRNRFSDPVDEVALETPLLKAAFDLGAVVIFPFADQHFNWLKHQTAFETILNEIKLVKKLYNIDDNRVYAGGHSDGARGAFWLALNKQTPFAANFGISYFPSSLTGNTPLNNLTNVLPFYGISAVNDQGFNIKTVEEIADYARSIGARWKSFAVDGEHTLPYDRPDAVAFVFDQLLKNSRNPVPDSIHWETDDVQNGQCFWLTITQLDTLKEAESWHKIYNPTLTSLKTGKKEIRNFNKNKTGAVAAKIIGNRIYLQTSQIAALTINVPVQWIDKYRSVQIFLNNRPVYSVPLKADKNILITEFIKTADRKLFVGQKIVIKIN